MSRFQFRLARVLRLRHAEEDLARTRFTERVAVMQRAEEVAQGLTNELRRSRDELFETRTHKRIPPEELLLAQNTLENLEQNLVEQRRLADELGGEVELLRAAWEAARRDRKALEQLEDRRRRDHRDREEQRANQELDETAQRRAMERRSAGSSSEFGPDADETESPGPNGSR